MREAPWQGDFLRYPALCRLRPQSRLLPAEEMVTISQAEWEKLQKKLARLETERNTARKQKKAAEQKQEAAEQRIIKLNAEQRETQQRFQNFRAESRSERLDWLGSLIFACIIFFSAYLSYLIFKEKCLDFFMMLISCAVPLLWMSDMPGSEETLVQILCYLGLMLCAAGAAVGMLLWAIWEWNCLTSVNGALCAAGCLLAGIHAYIERRRIKQEAR